MYRTFNMGLGIVLAVAPEDAGEVQSKLPESWVCGEVYRGSRSSLGVTMATYRIFYIERELKDRDLSDRINQIMDADITARTSSARRSGKRRTTARTGAGPGRLLP